MQVFQSNTNPRRFRITSAIDTTRRYIVELTHQYAIGDHTCTCQSHIQGGGSRCKHILYVLQKCLTHCPRIITRQGSRYELNIEDMAYIKFTDTNTRTPAYLDIAAVFDPAQPIEAIEPAPTLDQIEVALLCSLHGPQYRVLIDTPANLAYVQRGRHEVAAVLGTANLADLTDLFRRATFHIETDHAGITRRYQSSASSRYTEIFITHTPPAPKLSTWRTAPQGEPA